MDMWTHVLWFLAAIVTAWGAYRTGEAFATTRAEDRIDALEERNETMRREFNEQITSDRRIYLDLDKRHQEFVKSIADIAVLLAAPKMIVTGDGKGIPESGNGRIEFLEHPISVAEADRRAAQAQREAAEREEAAAVARERGDATDGVDEFEGLEPVLINDDEAVPVPRLTDAEEGHGSTRA